MLKSYIALVLTLGAVHSANARYHNDHYDFDSHQGHGSNQWDYDSWSGSKPGQNCYFSEDQNKKIVMDFYQEVFGDKNIEATDKYVSNKTYIQHNPGVDDGLIPFKNALKIWFKDAPKEKIDFQHVGADANYVWLHIKTTDQGKLASVMDLFRLDCGKIVEHWDVLQQVPATSANKHPMF